MYGSREIVIWKVFRFWAYENGDCSNKLEVHISLGFIYIGTVFVGIAYLHVEFEAYRFWMGVDMVMHNLQPMHKRKFA